MNVSLQIFDIFIHKNSKLYMTIFRVIEVTVARL